MNDPAFAVWIGGLPASSTSTIARALAGELASRGSWCRCRCARVRRPPAGVDSPRVDCPLEVCIALMSSRAAVTHGRSLGRSSARGRTTHRWAASVALDERSHRPTARVAPSAVSGGLSSSDSGGCGGVGRGKRVQKKPRSCKIRFAPSECRMRPGINLSTVLSESPLEPFAALASLHDPSA
jgi:hypothetical protein